LSTQVHRCNKPTAKGFCRRQVSAPGAPCGANHTIARSSATPTPLTPAASHDPIPTQPQPQTQEASEDGTVNGKSPEQWEVEANYWRARAHDARSRTAAATPSLWPAELQAELADARAKICEAQGTAPFIGLYTRQDDKAKPARVNARISTTPQLGARWTVFERDDLGQYGKVKAMVPVDDPQAAADRGYFEMPEAARAWARIRPDPNRPTERDRALVEVYRLDNERPYTQENLDDAIPTSGGEPIPAPVPARRRQTQRA
jgi:hypothetical protein